MAFVQTGFGRYRSERFPGRDMHSVELLLEIMSFDLRMGSVILMLSSLSHLRRVVAMPNRKGVNVAAIFAETPSEWSGYVWSI